MVGRDRTGSGKTLAFTLPVIEKLRNKNKFKNNKNGLPYVLILVPTRELCIQVANEWDKLKFSNQEYTVVKSYGGTSIQE